MVKEFKVGKWYAHNPYNDLNQLWYIKYIRTDNRNNKIASEYISNSKIYSNKEGKFSTEIKEYLYEVEISEIAQYLPLNHPDLLLIPENLIIHGCYIKHSIPNAKIVME